MVKNNVPTTVCGTGFPIPIAVSVVVSPPTSPTNLDLVFLFVSCIYLTTSI